MKLMSENDDQKIEEIEKIINLMRRDDSTDAPADSIQWAKNLFRAGIREPKKSLSQKIMAVLQLDLSPNRAVFGERSAGSATRQMLFQAGENSLDLRISKTNEGLHLHGQILGENFAGCAVKLAGQNGLFETRANELSEFHFAIARGGKYDLNVVGATEIVVEGIEL